MSQSPPPTDQRAGVKPIAFVLQSWQHFGTPVTLQIRPSDLNITWPSRTAVTQTLGKDITGWEDDFGLGLPSATIAGHTGWRVAAGSGMDGVKAFHALQNLICKDYHDTRQAMIDSGFDPDDVKLLFVDMLDDICWNISPGPFSLQRSRSQPLLMRYNFTFQAKGVDIDNPLMILPPGVSQKAGLDAFGKAIEKLESFANDVEGWAAKAISYKDKALAPIATTVKKFTDLSTAVFSTVDSVISSGKNIVGSTANSLISMASDVAQVGVNVYRTLASIASIPSYLKASLSKVANAFNEVVCIFKNSLKPPKIYEEYDGLYGASNCSSTTGGNPASAYANSNAFDLMQPVKGPVSISSGGMSGISAINRGDPVLAPMSIREMGRNLHAMNDGIFIEELAAAA